MIFRETWEQVFDGSKTETRRLLLPGDTLYFDDHRGIKVFEWLSLDPQGEHRRIMRPSMISRNGRMIYKVGAPRSIQTGRGVMAIGHYTIAALGCEWLQDITEPGAIREGMRSRDHFIQTWGKLWQGTGKDWADNPPVAVVGISDVVRYGGGS